MSDTLTISDADLDAMMEESLPCDLCGGPAEFMSRGHRCRPPGYRTFKCGKCLSAWKFDKEMILMQGERFCHGLCGEEIYSVEELAVYHPV